MSPSRNNSLRVQTLEPRFRWRAVAVFVVVIAGLAVAAYFTQDKIYRGYYGGLAGLATIALVIQYGRERALAFNRLSATGVVTDYAVPARSRWRILNWVISRFAPDVPLIKYSFVAFDQKTYEGQTGWGTQKLQKGATIIVLYDAANPAANHPLTSFVFFTFQ